MEYFDKRELLLRSTLELNSLIRENLNNPNLDAIQAMLILSISDEGAMSQSLLRSLLNISGTRATRAIKALTKAGLITNCTKEPTDKRCSIIELTAKGHELRSRYFGILLMTTKV